MSTVTSRVSPYLLIIVLALAAIPYKIFAQAQATILGPQDLGCLILAGATNGCGTIVNAAQAVDASPTTAASITPGPASSTAFLQVGFASEVHSFTNVKARIGFKPSDPLSTALITNTTITTYGAPTPGTLGQPATRGVKLQEVPLGFTTIRANTFIDITFTATIAFQYVELSTSSTANVNDAYSVLLYNVATTTDPPGTVFSAPLPVELITFTGKSRAAAVELNWVTASEKNSAYFVVERATEAQNQYKRLGEVAGAGNSTRATNYSFVDAQPVGLGYYRLRQVDLDGTSTYSPTVAVRSTPALVLLAYPNPSTGLLTVAGPPHTRFTIVNRLGQVVQRGEMGVANTSQVDLRGLPASVYFLRGEATGAVVKIVLAGADAPQ